jgi:hypothetical protein
MYYLVYLIQKRPIISKYQYFSGEHSSNRRNSGRAGGGRVRPTGESIVRFSDDRLRRILSRGARLPETVSAGGTIPSGVAARLRNV